MEQIEFKMIDLEFEKYIEQKECYVRLHDLFLEYKIRYLAETPKDKDETPLIWETEVTYYHRFVVKDDITNINIENVTNKKAEAKWCICIDFRGTSSMIKVYFKENALAKSLFSKLLLWRFNYTIE
jgi:hypothetical protein